MNNKSPDDLVQPELFSITSDDKATNGESPVAAEGRPCNVDIQKTHDVPANQPGIDPKNPDDIVISIQDDDKLSIGDQLRNARLKRQLSLDEIADSTRIQRHFIDALENNDFSQLPEATIFTKSFIKALCREYDLNTEHLIAEFEKAGYVSRRSDEADVSPHKFYYKGKSKPKRTGEKPATLKLAWLIAFLILSVAVIILIHVVNNENSENSNARHPGTGDTETYITEDDLLQFIVPEEIELRVLPIPEEEQGLPKPHR